MAASNMNWRPLYGFLILILMQIVFAQDPRFNRVSNFLYTNKALYTDTRYIDKIRYTNNLTGTKLSLKRLHRLEIMQEYYFSEYFKKNMFWIFDRIAAQRRF